MSHFGIKSQEHIGGGGQKEVFRVEIKENIYALKTIRVADERFIREMDISKKFHSHPGLPTIFKTEIIDGRTIILEEYIEGDDLSDKIEEFFGQEDKICELISQITNIMEPIWEQNYVHRDLKPQNIRIKKDNKPMILDFGIARVLDDESITTTGNQPLTPLYASPEQYEGKKHLVSYRTDFFCLGIIAYYLYTGDHPFGKTRIEIHESFKRNKNDFDTKSDRISNFCKRVLAIAPSERPGKVDQFKQLLKP